MTNASFAIGSNRENEKTRGGGFVSRASPYHFFNTSLRSMEREEVTGSAAKTRQRGTLDLLEDGKGRSRTANAARLWRCAATRCNGGQTGRKAAPDEKNALLQRTPNDQVHPGTLE